MSSREYIGVVIERDDHRLVVRYNTPDLKDAEIPRETALLANEDLPDSPFWVHVDTFDDGHVVSSPQGGEGAWVSAVVSRAKVVGPPTNRRIELTSGATIDPESLGLTDDRRANLAARHGLFVLSRSGGIEAVIANCPGGLDGVLAEANRLDQEDRKKSERTRAREAQRVADEKRRREEADQQQLQEQRANGELFINPYTFVPFPTGEASEVCPRAEAVGHDKLAPDRLAGKVSVTWTCVSPMLIREDDVLPDGTARINGSGVKGSVRSLHETLAGGCLRVLTDDFRPVYRDVAKARGHEDRWKLVEVASTNDSGQPATLRIFDDVIWIDLRKYQAFLSATRPGRLPRTGDRFQIQPGRIQNDKSSKRRVRSEDAFSRAPGERGDPSTYVLMLTDTRARQTGKGGGQKSQRPNGPPPIWMPAGRDAANTQTVACTDAYREYRIAADGAHDVRKVQNGSPTQGDLVDVFEPGETGGTAIGQRQQVQRTLPVGTILWALVQPGTPTAISKFSRSVLWRHVEKSSLGERVRPPLHACTGRNPDAPTGGDADHPWLCPTCRIFGHAETTERKIEEGKGQNNSANENQTSYAAHVRFGPGSPIDVSKLKSIELAPLGAPRPGAGQMYLDSGVKRGKTMQAKKEHRPLREWGAWQGNDTRMMRGRKYYWPADADKQAFPRYKRPPLDKKRPPLGDGVVSRGRLVPTGTTFESTVWFENLNKAELGGLLAALQPSLLLEPYRPPGPDADESPREELVTRLAGGKPFGLGQVRATLKVEVHKASRYAAPPQTDTAEPAYPNQALIAECVAEFEASVPEVIRGSSETDGIWPDLAAVLDPGHVDPSIVWYPPGEKWPDGSADDGWSPSKQFDESFRFFKMTDGSSVEGHSLPYLPPPREPHQEMPIRIRPPKSGARR